MGRVLDRDETESGNYNAPTIRVLRAPNSKETSRFVRAAARCGGMNGARFDLRN